MKVFKFGGASVKDAEAVVNLKEILERYKHEDLAVVVSAMGKMTNAFEKMLSAYFYQAQDLDPFLSEVENFHLQLSRKLFREDHVIFPLLEQMFAEIKEKTIALKRSDAAYDFAYDQVVSYGELLSTRIVSAFLNEHDIPNDWVDGRELILTNANYRRADLDWRATVTACKARWKSREHNILLTQGFIGKNESGYTTTLGREGSDFTAAILANALDAEEVTIWKDVPGILNADPKFFNGAEKLANISYHEAVELAYYGATVIHPKTIKPLQNKKIPLYVKSFLHPDEAGSLVNDNISRDALIPSFIFRTEQVLISISSLDYSFIMEENLSHIFGLFAKYGIKINLMQNAAISFSVCIDHERDRIDQLLRELKEAYKVLYNEKLELLTVRHYDQKTLDFLTEGKELLVVQKSRHTARIVMKDGHQV